MFFSKKKKGGCLDTLDSGHPPGSATVCHRAAQRVLYEEEQLDANAYDTVADRNRKWLS